MVKLTGRVVSGKGDFSQWIARLSHYYQQKTGMVLFPGTLNIQLEHPYILPSQPLRLEGEEYGGQVSVNIVPCRIFGRRAFILRTDKNNTGSGDHPLTIIEIATDIKLRDVYALVDGSMVQVELEDL